MRLKRSHYFLALSILPLFFALRNPSINESVHMATTAAFKPLFIAGTAVNNGISEVRDNTFLFFDLMRRDAYLKRKVHHLENRLAMMEETARENARLKKLLGFRGSNAYKTIAAKVIAREDSVLRKSLLIDKGTLDGVAKDMSVIVEEGLVGRVIEAGPTTARLLLLIDPASRVSAIDTETRSHGVVSGDGSTFLTMKYLDLDSGVGVEKTVITSGVTQLFSKGIRIGAIESIGKDTDGLHLAARIRPFVPFTKIEEVLCIVSSPEE